MSHPEYFPHPTGRFPSPDQEKEMLSKHLFLEDNPHVAYFQEKLKELNIKDPNQYILCNLLALSYGVHFYDHVSHGAISSLAGESPIVPVYYPDVQYQIYITHDSPYIFVNAANVDFAEDFSIDPMTLVGFSGEETLELPLYMCQILYGLEEANHLHLRELHKLHGKNGNSNKDHKQPSRLWHTSRFDTRLYRAKIWGEHAALIIQRQYLNFYLHKDFQETKENFEDYFHQTQDMRRQWVTKRRIKKEPLTIIIEI